jgi:glyoxylase-like metal-dependent hydrolase (beta-lactamase superfamily II)
MLEDHVGDVVRKGRLHAGVAVEAAAAAAGLPVDEYEAFEANGKATRPCQFGPLAALLGLNPAKLERIAAGWTPAPPDLGRWRELRVVTTTAGMSVNAYLVWDEVTRDAAVFDTGFDAAPLIQLIEENGLLLRYLFLTHGHADHVAGLATLRARYPKARLRSSAKSAPPDQRNRPNDFLMLGSLRITNRDTPGHAEDGVTYLVGTWPEDAPHVAFVGDAIFAGSMGGAAGNAALAKEKIVQQILSLPPATLICPGHGPLTTVAEEKANNPFF